MGNPMKTDFDRFKGLGGSEMAAAMGLSRWVSPLALWAQKTGKLKQDETPSEAAEWGNELEPLVSKKFEKKTGKKLRRDSRTFTHPNFPFLWGHIDRGVVGEDAVFEAKTASAYKFKEWAGAEDIPQEYVIQLMFYLGVTGKKIGYIACLIGGQKFVWKRLDFDQALYDKIIDSAVRFWQEFVLKDVPPIAQAGDSETLIKMFPESRPETLHFEGDEASEVNQLIEDREGALEAKRHADEELSKLEARLKQLLGEAEGGETHFYKYTWKTVEKKEYLVKAQKFRQLRCFKKQQA